MSHLTLPVLNAAPGRSTPSSVTGSVVFFPTGATTADQHGDDAGGTAVLDTLHDALISVDRDGRVTWLNDAARRVCGSIEGARFEEWAAHRQIFTGDPGPRCPVERLPLLRALRGEAVERAELYVAAEGLGRGRWYSVDASPLYRDGQIDGAVAISRDITAGKAVEQALAAERARLELLLGIATGANLADDASEALLEALTRLCHHVGWPVGHVYTVEGRSLVDTDLWYLADPRFELFRQATAQPLSRGADGMVGEVLRTATPVWMTAIGQSPRFARAAAANAVGLTSGFAAPVLVGREVGAVLEVYTDDARPIVGNLLRVVPEAAILLGRVIERDRARRAAEGYTAELERWSLVDELTGLGNRRGFLLLAGQQLALVRRQCRPGLLLLFDVDGLKRVNDELGHGAGDELLRDAARTLRAAVRDTDVVARLGGDELVVFAADATADDADGLVARIEAERLATNRRREPAWPLAWSVGAAAFEPERSRTLEALLATADTAMYRAKRAAHDEARRTG